MTADHARSGQGGAAVSSEGAGLQSQRLPLVLTITTLVQTLVSMAITLPTIMAPVVAPQLGVGPESVGFLMLLAGVTSMLSSPFSGGLIHRVGAFRLNQLSVLLLATALLLAASGNVYLVLLFALTLGFCQTTSISSAAYMLARVTPAHRISVVLSVRQSGMPIGAALTGLLAPALLLLFDWRALCALLAALLGLSLLAERPLRPLIEGTHQPRAGGSAASMPALMRALWVHPALRALTICGFAYTFAQTSLLVFMVSYLHLELGFGLAAAGGVFALCQGAAMASRLFWGWTADRLREPLQLLAWLGTASAALCVVAGSFAPAWPAWLVTLTVILMGATLTGWNSVYSGGVVRYSPRGAEGAMTGAVNFYGFMGNLLGPPVGALLVLYTRHYSVIFFACALAIIPVAWMCSVVGRGLVARGIHVTR